MVGEKLKEIKEQLLSYNSMVQKPEQLATRTKFANWLNTTRDTIWNKIQQNRNTSRKSKGIQDESVFPMMYMYPSCLQFTYLMHGVWAGLRPFCDLATIVEHRNHSHLLNIGEGGTGKTMLQKGLGAIFTIDEYDTIQKLQGGNNADAHTKSLIAINEIESLYMLGTADMKNLLDVTNTSTVNIKYQNNKKRPQGTLVVM